MASNDVPHGEQYDYARSQRGGLRTAHLKARLTSLAEAGVLATPSSQVMSLYLLSLQVLEGRPLSLKLSDTRVYEPQIRARLGTQVMSLAAVMTGDEPD